MSAALADSDLGRLRALARQWQGNPFGLGRARDLAAALDEIRARRPGGGDVAVLVGTGDSVPGIHARALLKAADLWGLNAVVAVEKIGTVRETLFTDRGRYRADVTVRCLNYAEITP